MSCPNCNDKPISPMDKKYLALYGQCWGCDKEAWNEGDLTLAEFENREETALEESIKDETLD